jgi:hypothetical protein
VRTGVVLLKYDLAALLAAAWKQWNQMLVQQLLVLLGIQRTFHFHQAANASS